LNNAATFRLEPSSPPVLHVEGDWTLRNYRALSHQIAQQRPAVDDQLVLTFSALTAFDTVGAKLLVDLLGVPAALRQTGEDSNLPRAWRGLLAAVAEAKAIAMPKAARRRRPGLPTCWNGPAWPPSTCAPARAACWVLPDCACRPWRPRSGVLRAGALRA
jgi:hypothetical protein